MAIPGQSAKLNVRQSVLVTNSPNLTSAVFMKFILK